MSKETLELLTEKNIKTAELTDIQRNDYMLEWFDKIVTISKQEKALECHCFSTDDSCGYLWHVFSYQILKCVSSDEARKAFDETEKYKSVLLSNCDNTAFLIENASLLKSSDVEKMCDVVLTSEDFKWTYVKTHETGLGPYFYAVTTE